MYFWYKEPCSRIKAEAKSRQGVRLENEEASLDKKREYSTRNRCGWHDFMTYMLCSQQEWCAKCRVSGPTQMKRFAMKLVVRPFGHHLASMSSWSMTYQIINNMKSKSYQNISSELYNRRKDNLRSVWSLCQSNIRIVSRRLPDLCRCYFCTLRSWPLFWYKSA